MVCLNLWVVSEVELLFYFKREGLRAYSLEKGQAPYQKTVCFFRLESGGQGPSSG